MLHRIKRLGANLAVRATPSLLLDYRFKFRKHHFETELWLVPLFCRKDACSVDVGANMGQYSYYMRKYSAEVVSFEPNLALWSHLRRLLGRRARLEAAALSDRAGEATFRYVDDNNGLATVEPRNELRTISDSGRIKQRSVELRTLDSFELANVSFIKIDVEGHEEAVIRGSVRTLASSQPVLLVESEERHNPGAPQRLVRLLHELRYSGYFVIDGNLRQLDGAEKLPNCDEGHGQAYVNNFIFVPWARQDLVEHMRRHLSRVNRVRADVG